MDPSTAANLARLFSLFLYVLLAVWYVVPWLRSRPRAEALIPLLWVHAFRYVALHLVDAQSAGYAISNALRDRIIYGDIVAMILAVSAIAALRARSRMSIPLVLLLVAETVTFIATLILGRGREEMAVVATGINWLVQSFYVPLVPVTLGLIIWQLVSRRREPIAVSRPAVELTPNANRELLMKTR
jgi:hypothetical protein